MMTMTISTWSTLISLRARLMPSCTSGHNSFSSFSTSLVSRGVGGTALYCWKYGQIILLKMQQNNAEILVKSCILFLKIVNFRPFCISWELLLRHLNGNLFCPWQTLKRIKMWRDLHIPSLWILLQTHRDPFVLNNLVNGQPLLWVGLQAALARKFCQTLQEQIILSNVTLDCNIVINTVIVIVSKDQIIGLSDCQIKIWSPWSDPSHLRRRLSTQALGTHTDPTW